MEAVDSSNKQYSLRWEKHAFNLATEAGYFFEDESFLDCTLSAEGQCIEAHKIILSASSSYLSSLLKITPDKHPILIFNDIKFEQLKSLVAFIYNGSVNVSESNIHDFLKAAQSLLIKGLYEDEYGNRTSENLKKIHLQDPKTNPRRILPKNPQVIRKPEQTSDPLKNFKRQRPLLPGNRFPDCEENLSKLQEISFTKYINQNLNAKNSDGTEPKWNGPGEDKPSKSPENYVVKSWKHNSVDDLNGRHKTGKSISENAKIFKNFQFKKFKLEKPREESEMKTKLPPEKTEPEPGKSRTEDSDDKIKTEPEIEQIMLVEPKQELMEEEDTNSEYDNGQTTGSETLTSEPETVYDGRSVPGYFQHTIVDRGIPVPLLMCKTSLSEPDSSDANWMPSGANISEHPPHQLTSIDNSQDLQCRTCSQDLPCPTCTKKYKSRYALNRHILYECGKARKSFSCDECGKKVTRQDTLQKHKLIHLVQHLKEHESDGDKPESVKIKKKC